MKHMLIALDVVIQLNTAIKAIGFEENGILHRLAAEFWYNFSFIILIEFRRLITKFRGCL